MEKKITDPFIIRGVLAGIAVALISGLVGCFVVWRRMSYYGESIAHSSLLGVGLGILLGIGINFGIIITCLIFGILFLWLQHSKILSTDTLLGVLAHLALAIGVIVISLNKIKIDIHAFLFGDILTVSTNDLWGMYLGVFIAIILICVNWSSLLLVTIDEDLAKAEGIFAGNSCGAAIKGLLQLKGKLKKTDVVVVLLHDSGSRYIGKIYNDVWMKSKKFLT